MRDSQEHLVYARASVHLPGLPLGEAARVDPSDPYIADALKNGYLVQESPPGSEQLEPSALDEPLEAPE